MIFIKLEPEAGYNQTYGTAGLNMTQALKTYSALSLKLSKFNVQTPATVLPKNSYDMLIGTSFLKDWKFKLDFKLMSFISLAKKYSSSTLSSRFLNC